MPTSERVLGGGIGVHIVARGRARSLPKTRGVRRYDARGRFSGRDGLDSIAIHGITHQQAEREGRPFTEVFLDFKRFIGPRTKTMIGSH